LLPTIFSEVKYVSAIYLVGMVIKIADDYLDDAKNGGNKQLSLASKLGKGVNLYGLLAFAVAVKLNQGSACTLLFASYSVGMLKDPDLILPTHVSAALESLAVVVVGILLWGWLEMLSSLTIMSTVQFVDDLLDLKVDREGGFANLVDRWGKVEILLLTLLTCYLSLLFDWKKTIAIGIMAPLVNYHVVALGEGRHGGE
jgi:hypothetical protein